MADELEQARKLLRASKLLAMGACDRRPRFGHGAHEPVACRPRLTSAKRPQQGCSGTAATVAASTCRERQAEPS